MEPWMATDDFRSLAELADRRKEVALKIERVLLIRNLVGDWNPERLMEYRSLCDEELALIRSMDALMEASV
jgi:hypothetical protein